MTKLVVQAVDSRYMYIIELITVDKITGTTDINTICRIVTQNISSSNLRNNVS